MSLKHKVITIFTLAVVFIALSSVSFGQSSDGDSDSTKVEKKRGKKGMYGKRGKRGRHGKRGRRGGMRIFEQLNLSDSQKTQIQNILKSNREKRMANKEANEAHRKEVRELMMAKRDGLATEAQEKRLAEIKAQRKAEHQKLENELISVLNAEQRQKYETLKAERKKKMEERKKMRKERKKSMKKTDG